MTFLTLLAALALHDVVTSIGAVAYLRYTRWRNVRRLVKLMKDDFNAYLQDGPATEPDVRRSRGHGNRAN